jgi:hypothetical protein
MRFARVFSAYGEGESHLSSESIPGAFGIEHAFLENECYSKMVNEIQASTKSH